MGNVTPRPPALPTRFGLLPKALVTLSVLVGTLSLALSTSFLRVISRRLEAELEARGSYLVRSLAKTGRYGVFTSFPEILAPIAEGAFEGGEVLFVEIVDRDGRSLVIRRDEAFPESRIRPLAREDVRHLSTIAPRIDLLTDGGLPRYEFLFPVILEKPAAEGEDIVLDHELATPRAVTFERIGAVRVGLSLSTLARELRRVRYQVLAVTLVAAAVTFGLTGVFLRRIIGPVTGLAEASRRISEGDFSLRAPVRGRDEISLLAGAFNDMSARVESFQQSLERQVADRTAALAAKTRDMEEFVYTVSHDLKAPVVSTHGLVSLLHDEFGSTLPPEGLVYVERIKANAAHMERLIKDLFELSRIDRGREPKEIVRTAELVADVLLEHDAQIRAASIAVDVAPDLPDCFGHRDQIARVLDNLVGNAIKFRKGRLAGSITIAGRQEPDGTALSVKDDGIGIEPGHHGKIFGLFQRLHTDREFPGTGMGLAIVKKIVERHGGSIEVRSELGKGSEFIVRLPRDAAPAWPATPPRGRPEAERGDDMLDVSRT